LGRIPIALKNDSLGILALQKALTLDTSQVDVYGEIAATLYQLGKYKEAGDAYKVFDDKSRKATLQDHFKEGFSYFEAFKNQLIAQQTDPKVKLDSTMLTQADSAFSYIERKLTTPNYQVVYYHAQAKDFEDGDRNNIKGLAKPYYEQLIQLKGATPDDKTKPMLVNAYVYLGNYYEFKEKDHAKAVDAFNKAKDLDPTDARVTYYFQTAGKSK